MKNNNQEQIDRINKIIENNMYNSIDILGDVMICFANNKLEKDNATYRIKKKKKKKNIFDFYDIDIKNKK